eukprot:365477-Chlamydomonas_euryale.AAC.12
MALTTHASVLRLVCAFGKGRNYPMDVYGVIAVGWQKLSVNPGGEPSGGSRLVSCKVNPAMWNHTTVLLSIAGKACVCHPLALVVPNCMVTTCCGAGQACDGNTNLDGYTCIRSVCCNGERIPRSSLFPTLNLYQRLPQDALEEP